MFIRCQEKNLNITLDETVDEVFVQVLEQLAHSQPPANDSAIHSNGPLQSVEVHVQVPLFITNLTLSSSNSNPIEMLTERLTFPFASLTIAREPIIPPPISLST